MERINEILNFIDNNQPQPETDKSLFSEPQPETEMAQRANWLSDGQKQIPTPDKSLCLGLSSGQVSEQEMAQRANWLSDGQKAQPLAETVAEPLTETVAEPTNNLYDGDNKKYNTIKRAINKLLTKGTFPAVINGTVFNNSSDLQNYKQNLLTSYREYNKKLTKKNLKEFTEKHPPEELEELDKEKILMDDEIIYSQGKIIGFVCNGKHYKIPTTNRKKTKEIISNLQPEAKKELLTTEDPDKFINITKTNIKSPQLQQDLELHRDINKLQKDNTWNRQIYYNLMLREMEKQKMVQRTSGWLSEPQQNQNSSSNRPSPKAVQFGVNPRLFNKGFK